MPRTSLRKQKKANKTEPLNRKEWIKREPTTELGHRIVSATVEEFAAKGVLGARVAEITRRAGTADPAFYQYFGGMKQAALFIMSEYYWAPLNLLLSHYKDITDDPKKLYDAVLNALIQSREDDHSRPWLAESNVFQIVVTQMRNPFLMPESVLDSDYINFIEQLEGIINAGQKEKVFSAWLRPSLLAQLLVSTLHGLLMQNSMALHPITAQEDEIRRVADHLLGVKR
jgi:AcrR family transcriptional regulator